MSRFVCNTCNRGFTTKYGLQKHSNKKIPCTADKQTKHQCNICYIYLSSKRNLDNHLFNHRLDNIKIDNVEENNLIDDNSIENNLIEDNLKIDPINILPNNSIQITVEEYNYFKSLENELHKINNKVNTLNDENQKLKDENTKLNSMICTTNNGTINVDNSTNIDNSVTNNIQINIIPFHDTVIDFKHIAETFKDPNSALYDFSKIFNYEHLNFPKRQNGLNFSQRCKEEKIRKIVSNNIKRDIPLVSRGFIDILSRHFSRPEYKNIKQITRNMYKLYNGNDTWILITSDDTKKELHKKVIKSLIENHIPNSILHAENATKFIKNDYHKNHQEYCCYHNNEFIAMIKAI